MNLHFQINQTEHEFDIPSQTTLLHTLRNEDYYGVKHRCERANAESVPCCSMESRSIRV